jgi:hypothetical protein
MHHQQLKSTTDSSDQWQKCQQRRRRTCCAGGIVHLHDVHLERLRDHGTHVLREFEFHERRRGGRGGDGGSSSMGRVRTRRRRSSSYLQHPLAEIRNAGTSPAADDVPQTRCRMLRFCMICLTRSSCECLTCSSRRIHFVHNIRNSLGDSHLSQSDVAGMKQKLGYGNALVAKIEDLVIFCGGGSSGTDAAEARVTAARGQNVPAQQSSCWVDDACREPGLP